MSSELLGRVSGRPIEHRFFTTMAIALAAVVFVGFAQTFFLRPWFPDAPANSPSETLFYGHGTVFALWYALLIVQTGLIASGNRALHRRLGWVGAGLAVAMVVLGVWGALVAARRGFIGIPIPGPVFLAIPLADMLVFTPLVVLAVIRRNDAASHKRLMLLASISLLAAALARWPIELAKTPPGFFGLMDLFVVALAIYDLTTRGRLHPATLWGGLALIASQPLRLWISGTEAWGRFAGWLLA